MKIIILFNIFFVVHLIKAASVTRNIQNEIVRVKRNDEMMGAAVGAATGMATAFMDVASKGAAAKDERDFEADIPFASFKGKQNTKMNVGDGNEEDYRRRKRAPCGGKKKSKDVTTVEPPIAEDGAERRKRQAINDPDNVRPNFDGKTAIQSFLDSFVELAKKIGNLFVPSDPNNPQTRQQEMDDRY